ncbi:MAG: alkaline phosphatase [Gammaproteobacteria bacterium]|nr:alkaline phosphatase [Gammaproteobacteria bacterium]
MKFAHDRLVIGVSLMLACGLAIAEETPESWYEDGQAQVERNREIARKAAKNTEKRAKNVILFVGDGMGVSTVTAARIYEGQTLGKTGEEHELFFETFPNIALSKVYNTNQQTPDSAGTMTAMMTGVKSKAGIISVNQYATRGDCGSQTGNELTTFLEQAEMAGLSTGVVSTARLTHATPAATYAHVMDRNFEDDRDASKFANPGSCKDIASQLIDFPHGDGIEVAMGGGRRSFIQRIEGADPETGGKGERLDGRDLTAEWAARPGAEYVWNRAGFDGIDPESTSHLLGLFESSHMEYELDRGIDLGGEPSLSEMTTKAIEILDNNEEGFFLHVESGRIDHAHHATNPKRALEDAVEFAAAVRTAYENTDPEETLIIVTADHSHVFTMAGYPTRGNPILGKVVANDSAGNPKDEFELAEDQMPYTTLGYQNGRRLAEPPGAATADAIDHKSINMSGRADLVGVDTEEEGFHSETLVPLGSETHGGEDVAIYATGPGSSLVNGVMEQNAIYHVMKRASRLSEEE